jgi:peroxin-5
LDNAFQSLEATSVTPTSERELQAEQSQDGSGPQEADILARTAGLLVQSVDHEKNPKFSNSQFLGLMKQLRDRTAIVEGDDIVAAPPDWPLGNNSPVSVDPKGKSKAVPTSFAVVQEPGISQLSSPLAEEVVPIGSQVDENEAYFRQDNEDYVQYWKAHHAPVPPVVAPPQEWQELEREWQRFESTTPGVGPLTVYQFQPENPYLLEEWSRNHYMHGGKPQVRSLSEVCDFCSMCSQNLSSGILLQNVLQMEAAVQRDPTDARAWFELGVKQQENEREQQAISALKRALELDPTHLASWLALAVSYTNEGDRRETYQTILNWVRHNGKYRDIVAVFEESNGRSTDGTEEFQKLIDCLIAMARGVAQPGTGSTEIDADVQIALAILLNSNEVIVSGLLRWARVLTKYFRIIADLRTASVLRYPFVLMYANF